MSEVDHVGMFTEVDAAENPGVFISLMDRVQDAPDVRDDALEAWKRGLEYANLAGTFYLGMTVFSAVGRKP